MLQTALVLITEFNPSVDRVESNNMHSQILMIMVYPAQFTHHLRHSGEIVAGQIADRCSRLWQKRTGPGATYPGTTDEGKKRCCNDFIIHDCLPFN